MESVRMKNPGCNDQGFVSSLPGKKIHADKFHFANIVHNLLDNSIKYSKGEANIFSRDQR